MPLNIHPFGYLSKKLQTNRFIFSRDPNRPMSVPVQWPKYEHEYKLYLEIKIHMNEESVKSRSNEKRYYFWNNLIPSLTSRPISYCVQPNIGRVVNEQKVFYGFFPIRLLGELD